MMVYNDVDGLRYKTERSIYKECLSESYNDSEIGELSKELYRVVKAYDRKCYPKEFDKFKATFIAGIIKAFRNINKNNKGEYLNELLDILLQGNIDPYTFPGYLEMICIKDRIDDYEMNDFLSTQRITVKDLEDKDYHHPFLKLLYVFKKYLEEYSSRYKSGSELIFFLQQLTHTLNYYYINDLDSVELDYSLNYIVTNFPILFSYYDLNGYKDYQIELRDKILEKTINYEFRNKKTII